MKIIFLLYIEILLNISIICKNNKIVVLPLIKKDDSYLSKIKNVTEIIQFIFCEQHIAEFMIGTPEQKSHIIIRPGESNIYFTSYKHNTTNNDQTNKLINLKYKNIKYFNNDQSKSIEINDTTSRSFYYNNFKEWAIINDQFNISSKKYKINFVLTTFIHYEEVGSLGLLPVEKKNVNQFTPSFLYQLKQNNLIDNYTWFIYYGEKNVNNYLIIGCSPHEFIIPETGKNIFPDLDYDNDYRNTDDQIFVDEPQLQLVFNDIYITSNMSN